MRLCDRAPVNPASEQPTQRTGPYRLQSCHDSQDNEVRLQLFALACNLADFSRGLALPTSIKQWSLTPMGEKLVKIGAKVVEHSRYVIFQLAEVAVPRVLFEQILKRIRRFRPVPL